MTWPPEAWPDRKKRTEKMYLWKSGMLHTRQGETGRNVRTKFFLTDYSKSVIRGNLLQGGNERRWFRGPGEE